MGERFTVLVRRLGGILVAGALVASAGVAPAPVAAAITRTQTTTTPVTAAAAAPTVSAIAAGYGHTCAVLATGTVACWGKNIYGGLGDGTTTDRRTPVMVRGLSGVTAIAAGQDHTCALRASGSVACWGYNADGQLGDGTTTDSHTPVTVSGISGATAIAAGEGHTCAVLDSGDVYCWGSNQFGQLGDDSTTSSPTPVMVRGLASGVTAIAAGYSHTCALLESGSIACWGRNDNGQLGDGTFTERHHPVAVSGISGAIAIAAGERHTCAIDSRSVSCWGYNFWGQLGDGTYDSSPTPVHVSLGSDVDAIAAGGLHTCAMSSSSGVYCWGYNFSGQLGDGTSGTDSSVPVPVTGIAGATAIAAGPGHTCAVTTTVGLACWGSNWDGELGIGTLTPNHSSYAIPVVWPRVTAIAAGQQSCALLVSGGVACWGLNQFGQLGDGTTTESHTPDAVGGVSGATAIAAGGFHTCALLGWGGVSCWGLDDHGQLGDGTTTDRYTPGAVSGVSTATAIAAGGFHTCALLSSGGVACWGDNQYGQLGDNSTTDSHTPVAVSGVSTATAITAGGYHTCALLASGGVRCWGHNYFGQLGNNSTTNSATQVMVSGVSTATAIAAAGYHTCALLASGSASCWGYNGNGQLGDGTTTDSHTPVVVSGVSAATAIATSEGHTCALLGSGGLACWGRNYYGQIGDDTTTDRHIPVAVSGISDAIAIAAGVFDTCSLRASGSVVCWGSNYGGQVGDGTTTDRHTPVAVLWTPGAPTGVSAIPGAASAQVSWSAPAWDGGSAITGYTVTSAPGGFTCSPTPATATSCTVGGLTNGSAYTFTVKATTGDGSGPASTASSPVTPRTVPDAPTGVSAIAGSTTADVSWSAPSSNGGSAITAYTVTSSPDGKTCATTGALSCTVSGLSNGTAYTFTVKATNGVGSGTASTASGPVIPRTVPGAPSGVSAIPGNTTATVSWTAPLSNGGSVITGYTVTSSPDGKTCVTTGALSCTVSALSNGTAYTFTVTASNTAGLGSPSAASAAVTPRTVPGAPSGVSAIPGNTTATVSWTAPLSNGGSVITGYTVTSSPDGKTCVTTVALSCTVSALSNGTAYTFTVKATNGAGSGTASTASAAVTPAGPAVGPPGAPTGVSAIPGAASAQVSWSAPAWDGGSAITGYTVTSAPDGKTCATNGALSCTVSALSNGTSYTFSVTASNVAGSGPSAASAAVIPRTVPGAPTGVTAVAGNASATVSWTAPASDGGSAITGYTVTSAPDGKTCATAGALSCTVSGLTNGTAYTFTVKATNVAGSGTASTASDPVIPRTVPGAPTGVTAVPGNASADVSWTAPGSDGGSAITGYTVTSSPDGKTCATTGALSCTVSGLTNGTAYTFTVRATNAAGPGDPSTASSPVTPAGPAVGAPGAPTGVSAIAGNASATVSWTPPGSDGGSAITAYTVTSTPGGKTCIPTPATGTSCTVSGLTNGTAYTFTVRATNAAGPGDPSTASSPVTPAGPAVGAPGAPTGVTAVAGNASADVSWIAPDSDGGSAITGYAVTSTPDGKTCAPTLATGTACTVSGLRNSVEYTFTVRATNAAGSTPSAASNLVAPTTGTITATIAKITVGKSATSTIPLALAWSTGLDGPGVAYVLERLGGGTCSALVLPGTSARSASVAVPPGIACAHRVRPTTAGGAIGAWISGSTLRALARQDGTSTVKLGGSGWTKTSAGSPYGGSLRYTASAGRTAKTTFTGTGIAWVSSLGKNRGRAEVWLDGKRVATISLYKKTTTARSIVWSSTSLSTSRTHTLLIKVLGKHVKGATGNRVDIDAFLVLAP